MSREDFVLVLKVVVRRSRPTTLLKKTTTQIFPYKFKKKLIKTSIHRTTSSDCLYGLYNNFESFHVLF